MIEGWGNLSLKEIGNVITGSTPNTKNKEFYEDGNINFFSPFDFTGYQVLSNAEKKVTNLGLHYSRQIKENSIMTVCIGSTIGKMAINKDVCCTNQQINTLEIFDTNNYKFVFYSMKAYIPNQLNRIMGLQAVPIVNKKAFEELFVPIPIEKKEQQKIADILTSVDNAIESTSKIIAKQKRIKTALMQDLLKSGIDENGKIRDEETHQYKDSPLGQIPVEWEVKLIKNVTEDNKQGYYTNEKYTKEGMPLIRITDLKNPEIEFTNMPRVPYNLKISEQFKVNKNDFLFARSGAIGRYGIFRGNFENVIFASYIIKFSFCNYLDSYFFGYFFEDNIINFQLNQIIQGSSNININAENIKNMYIKLPLLPEQQKISKILSKQDEAIEQEEKKLTKLQRIKTALMQDLLSGKVRVKYE